MVMVEPPVLMPLVADEGRVAMRELSVRFFGRSNFIVLINKRAM